MGFVSNEMKRRKRRKLEGEGDVRKDPYEMTEQSHIRQKNKGVV